MTARASANGHRAEPPHRPVDWSAVGYRPAEGTPTPRCWCGGVWIDDEAGRHAHRVVFLHEPRLPEPAPKEDP